MLGCKRDGAATLPTQPRTHLQHFRRQTSTPRLTWLSALVKIGSFLQMASSVHGKPPSRGGRNVSSCVPLPCTPRTLNFMRRFKQLDVPTRPLFLPYILPLTVSVPCQTIPLSFFLGFLLHLLTHRAGPRSAIRSFLLSTSLVYLACSAGGSFLSAYTTKPKSSHNEVHFGTTAGSGPRGRSDVHGGSPSSSRKRSPDAYRTSTSYLREIQADTRRSS